jgi:tripartite-type tricarboxylate transporter receptor subunit TctC
MKNTQMFKTLALFAATALFGLGVQAQGVYPDKSIRLVVPYNAGGGTDVMARIMAEKLKERIGANVIVENRAGASGTLAVKRKQITS